MKLTRTKALLAIATGLIAATVTVAPSYAADDPSNADGNPIIAVSSKTDRSGAVVLEGAALSGTKWIYVKNPAGIAKVIFFIDQPDFGTIHKIENVKPFDLMGTKADGNAAGLDTATLKDGRHQISAVTLSTGGAVAVLRSSFTVTNKNSTVTPPAASAPPAKPLPPASEQVALRAALSGSAIAEGNGDTDGSGSVDGTLDVANRTFCYGLVLKGIDTATTAKIHRGAVGVEGPAVADMLVPQAGSVSKQIDACNIIPADVAQRIAANPANYYIEVATGVFRDGAIRGQLSR